MTQQARILVLGASSRLGTMLRRYWDRTALYPIWQFRTLPAKPVSYGEISIFDPLLGPPSLEPVDTVLSLAGILPGKGDMSLNTDFGLAAVECARALQANHVFLASSSAVYGPSDIALVEAARPNPRTAYGAAKLKMEETALERASHYGLGTTALRIGNVAGADSLLARPDTWRRLDQFDSGQGPVRSYIGPRAFSVILQALMRKACLGAHVPTHLNFALQGAIAMSDLCAAAELEVHWRAAPATALETVVLDVTRLANLVDVPRADARDVVSDWSGYRESDQSEQLGEK